MKLVPVILCLLGLPTPICTACGFAAASEPFPSLAELLKEYRALGLPMPPDASKLVRFESGGGGIVNGKVQPKVYGLAFQVKPGTEMVNPVLLRGTHQWQPSWKVHAREIEPDPVAVKDLDSGVEDSLALAIQCHARGWDKLARHLLEQYLKEDTLPAPRRLVKLAWEYWVNHLTRPKVDRGLVAKRLQELIRRDPMLNTEQNRALLKSLDLALVPSKARPGTVEALIDDLVDYDADAGTLGWFERSDQYWRLAELGFEAVPALISHLDDDRLTRAMMRGFNNFPSWHLRVNDVVGDLLEGLAAEKLDRGAEGKNVGGGWLRRQQGYPVTADAARTWWEKASKVGEETYLLDHVLPTRRDKTRAVPTSQHLLRVILAKYPKRIPDLYRVVLEKRSDLRSEALVEAFCLSKLPDKEKIDLFLLGAKHEQLDHRLPALRALNTLDQKQFTSLLLATIEGLPADVQADYWCCDEARIGPLAIESDDPRVWAALERVAKRSALGLRMELLNRFGDSRDPRRRVERLRLLSSFLDDRALRDNKSDTRFAGPGAGFQYEKIEVRDFVAVEIAGLLGIEVELDLDRTRAEWAKIRDKIREGLKRELAKMK